jgi:hypothetical protein
MSQQQKNIFLWIGIIGLVIITTPWFGSLYEYIIGRPVSSSFWGPSNPEYIQGFLMAIVFIPTLLLTIFRKNYKQIIPFIGFVLLLDISIGAWWDGVVFDLALALIAWILGQGILLVRRAIK